MRKQFGYGMLTVYALEKGMGRIMKRKSMGLAIFGMSVFLLFPHRQITYASQPEITDEVNSEKDKEVDEEQNTGDFIIEDGHLVEYRGYDAKVVIPDNVTSISQFAFMGNKEIVDVTIPCGVTVTEIITRKDKSEGIIETLNSTKISFWPKSS